MAFVATSFVAAFLLFLVEPMFAKMALPLLGGSSDVWTLCVLFYQCTLLAAYVYAHALQRLRRVRDQAIVHGLLGLLALFSLPIVLHGAENPPGGGVLFWVLGVLFATVGLPFFVLSAMSPLLQAWFSAGRPRANPYGLYAASNAGSVLALALYPLALEPQFGLGVQSRWWSLGYLLFVALAATCAFVTRAAQVAPVPARPPQLDRRRELRWIALAFIPSSLMLSVTSYLSTSVAPLPLLWTLPLAIYLCTFIVVFGSDATRAARFASRAAPIALVPLIFLLCTRSTMPSVSLTIALHLGAFALIALVCHYRAAADRPPAGGLTAFYACLAIGGALGGIFSGAIAPLIFGDLYEYPLVLGLACFALLPRDSEARRPFVRSDIIIPAVLVSLFAALLVTSGRLPGIDPQLTARIIVGAATFACFTLAYRPLRYGLAVLGVLVWGTFGTNPLHSIIVERNLYGTKAVDEIGVRWHALAHGSTLHGAQRLTPQYELLPETYYTRSGPLGDIFGLLSRDTRSVGVIGLGVGTAACYAKPGQQWTFYEIDPQVAAIARDDRYFTYLKRCAPTAGVRLGDGRLMLQHDSSRFGLLILDAYSSDAIPTHLLTREALAVYRSHLAADGLIAFHLSNRYFNFQSTAAGLAHDAGLHALVRFDDTVDAADRQIEKSPSVWMIVAQSSSTFGRLQHDSRWTIPVAGRLWTDDYSSIVTILRPGWWK